ncbi:protein of unknown function [Parapedobacter luteus]|uniref:DUF4407 domain-containing protein n=1 Tax=Parapedobacter luteus TaxID=623280 RepID=A0A1T5FIV5_9SPHI|nr:DUF4407 domain-containing protein [Parapedobacter luteus]SKB96047.1 protein of unknown function [Parapedobacter luteus]
MDKKSAYLRFCCFLTGLSYPLIRNSSEQSVKNAKKYTGALLIIMLVWFFIGYCFATRYLHMGIGGGVIGGVLMSFVILQIERIIILSHHISWGGKLFRVILGLVMAILGALIMDQFTFQDDIELRKVQVLDIRVKEAIKTSENDIRMQVEELDSVLEISNTRLFALSEELQKRPVIITNYTTSSVTKDSSGNNVNSTTQRNTAIVDNPLKVEFDFLQAQITELNGKKFELLNSLTDLKRKKEEELKSATGFLDELTLLKEVIASNWVGMFVYALFLFFFLALELFILIMKLSDKESDYDKLVDHQMDIRIEMLQRLKA